MQLHTIEPVSAPRIFTGALSPEVFTVSTLLSMPAVWTAVVERALPYDVLFERYLIVLFTIALLAELIRRLGEGGALPPETQGTGDAAAVAGGAMVATQVFDTGFDAGFDSFDTGLGDLAADAFGADGLATDHPGDVAGPLDAPVGDQLDPLALDAPLVDEFGLGDIDMMDLSPLDLNADPFADPA